MTCPTDRTMLGRLARSLRARLAASKDDGGFILLEVMIALTLITVIMAAVGVEYVSGVANSAHERDLVNATQLAGSAMNDVRALSPSDLLTGRTQAAVTSERTILLANPRVASWVSGSSGQLAFNDVNNTSFATSVDNGGTSTAVRVAVPTVATTLKTNSVTYSVYKYVECSMTSPLVQNQQVNSGDPLTYQRNCAPITRTVVGGVAQASYLRVIVAAVWNTAGCPSTGCAFVTSTDIDGHANPTFNINQSLPPTPVATNPGSQGWAVNSTVSLQLTVQNGTGVTPFTWSVTAGALPAGLQLSPAGLISGTPTTQQSATNITVMVTDGFIRTGSTTFSIAVYPPLTFVSIAGTPVGASSPTLISNTTADTLNTSVVVSGGSGTGYTYSLASGSLPAGVALNSGSGAITGRATTAGTSNFGITVVDSAGITATTAVSWTITVPPISLTNPGAQVSTVNQAIQTLQLSANGGTPPYRYSAANLPGGLSLNTSTGAITGTPTATTPAGNPPTVTITVTDSLGASISQQFTWSVLARPTLAAVPNQLSARGNAVSVRASGTCPNGGCSYSISGQPSGISIDQTGLISGTVSTSASTATQQVSVTVTDAAGVTATTSFSWTITSRYVAAVQATGPSVFWRLNDASGSTAADSSGNSATGTYTGSGATAPGYATSATAAEGASGQGVTLNGAQVVGNVAYAPQPPTIYTEMLWFKTSMTTGGAIARFGDSNSGSNVQNDRLIYMLANGQISFGVCPGAFRIITSQRAYNDGAWHQVAVTQGSDGMHLYLDGTQVATDPQTYAQSGYTGYWQLGGATTSGWTGGTSGVFKGTVSDAAMWTKQLSAAQISTIYQSMGA